MLWSQSSMQLPLFLVSQETRPDPPCERKKFLVFPLIYYQKTLREDLIEMREMDRIRAQWTANLVDCTHQSRARLCGSVQLSIKWVDSRDLLHVHTSIDLLWFDLRDNPSGKTFSTADSQWNNECYCFLSIEIVNSPLMAVIVSFSSVFQELVLVFLCVSLLLSCRM